MFFFQKLLLFYVFFWDIFCCALMFLLVCLFDIFGFCRRGRVVAPKLIFLQNNVLG